MRLSSGSSSLLGRGFYKGEGVVMVERIGGWVGAVMGVWGEYRVDVLVGGVDVVVMAVRE